MRLERELLYKQSEDLADAAAEHIKWVARTLVAIGPNVASSMSATQPMRHDEVEAIRALLPSLAAQYGLRARMEEENGSVTVTFERRPK